nr:hypothetical protein Q903MT_gene6214 [Picea sitchensis]
MKNNSHSYLTDSMASYPGSRASFPLPAGPQVEPSPHFLSRMV